MTVDHRALRPYAPLAILVMTIGLGWFVFVRPLSADSARNRERIESLGQREQGLRRELSPPAPRGAAVDPVAAFERRVPAGDPSAALLEQVARLASSARARNLLISTVEGSAVSPAAPGQAPQRDPRFALFDTPLSHVPIRIAFDTDFTSLGQFLWAFRDLPTAVEIGSLSVALPPADPEEGVTRTDSLRVSLMLYAYSRRPPAAVKASNPVTR